VGEGFQKALWSLITCGCDNRLKIQSSRNTFRALFGFETTFGIFFNATCTSVRSQMCSLKSAGTDSLPSLTQLCGRTLSPVSVSSAKHTLEKLPDPRYFSSTYLGPTCAFPKALSRRVTLLDRESVSRPQTLTDDMLHPNVVTLLLLRHLWSFRP
jgi:hypothetical protein